MYRKESTYPLHVTQLQICLNTKTCSLSIVKLGHLFKYNENGYGECVKRMKNVSSMSHISLE